MLASTSSSCATSGPAIAFSMVRVLSAIVTDWSASKSPPDAVTVSVPLADTPLGDAATSSVSVADCGSRDGSPPVGAGRHLDVDPLDREPRAARLAVSFGALSLKNAVTVTCARMYPPRTSPPPSPRK